MNNKSIECECGKIIIGNSDSQLKYNLEKHKKSERHKKIMKIKERLEKK